ncbi:MAG: DUF120 domain-containing protein [Myxococcota bacterium]
MKGVIVAGKGKDGVLTPTTAWEKSLGYRPYRGSLNVIVDGKDWQRMVKWPYIWGPKPHGRGRTRYRPVLIEGIQGHMKLSKARRGFVFLFAPVKLRDALGVENGDTIRVEMRT